MAFLLFQSVGGNCDAIAGMPWELRQPIRGEDDACWPIRGREWRCMTLRDRVMTFVTLDLSLIISSLQTSGIWWMLLKCNAANILTENWESPVKWRRPRVCQCWSSWPSPRCPRLGKFPRMILRVMLVMMIRTSFFCSSITRIPRQHWAPAPGRVDTKFRTFHIFVQGFTVMTAADTKMHWEDQTFQKFLFQNTEPHGFSEAYHGHCTFSRQGNNINA